MRAARKRRRPDGLQQGTLWDPHLQQVIEAVVEEDLRIEHHDHEHPNEHLEHLFVEIEVDRTNGLRIGAREVPDLFFALAPHRTGDLVRAHAHAVVANVVLEVLLLLGDVGHDEVAHRALVAVQHQFERRVVDVVAEALHQVEHALFRQPAGGDDGVEVAAVPVRQPAVAQDEIQNVFLQDALLVDPGGRNLNAFLEYLLGVRGQAARHLAADVGHMTEHRHPTDQAMVLEDGQQHQPVGKVADGCRATVGVIGEDDVAFLDGAVIGFFEAMNERAKLTDDHLAVAVGDHREFVILFAYSRRHGGAVQNGVHLDPRRSERTLDEIEGDRIDFYLFELLLVGFNDIGWHFRSPLRQLTGRIRMFPTRSTSP